MAISFEVSHILKHPQPFVRGASPTFASGLLVVSALEGYLLDWYTQQRLNLDAHGGWREWLPQEIAPLSGPLWYCDEAQVAGVLRPVGDGWVWKYIWQVNIARGGRWLLSQAHPMTLED